jgi:hypothetical protein
MVREARPRVGAVMTLAAAWFVLGLVRHALGDLAPRWSGLELHGLAHYAWDAAFHAPPVGLAAVAVARAPEVGPSS